ncbi:MAG: amino acid adenylation domain-containing protein [Chloroflexi bacterium]|nr:amino acid adenylation domain-containing protein [Acidobacteriota bacterium]MCA1587949.1 amino acid adenylation domain-containing protein [Chloroflexota bacterium]MCA1719572.1 amino acid adenylation domain-containing protein [Actinomycetota bacterium]
MAEQALLRPSSVAVIDGVERITYRELDRRANRLANHLVSQGVSRGELVGIRLERSAEMVVAMLAVLKTGAAYLPLDDASPDERIGFMVADAGVSLVLTTSRSVDMGGDESPPAVTSSADDLMYVMYTSGSTGRPNGSRIRHRSVVRLVSDTDFVDFRPHDRVAHACDVCFDPATFEVWGALVNGACLVVVPHESVLAPHEFTARVRALGISVLWLTSGLFNTIVAAVPDAFVTVTHLLVGGEAVDARRVREVLRAGPPRRLVNAYGPTECTVFASWHLVRDVPDDATTVPIGKPVSGTRIRLVDGEICIGGDGLADGYLNRPELTRERFVPLDGELLFRTGDLGRYGPEGLEYLGRRDRQVKLRGFRVEPGEVEAVLNAQPGVRQSVVVVREDRAGAKVLVAYVVPESVPGDSAVEEWRGLYDEVIYSDVGAGPDPAFDLASWVSSYTGLPLPAEEMREQVERTVERVLALRPRRVLDIGCGTGLLLFRIAPACDEYVATDISAVALDHVRAHLAALPQVRLWQRPADDFSGVEPGSFDVVVLNSVVQHFPSAEYLVEVLRQAVAAVARQGFVFVGDVRSLPLLEAFHRSLGRSSREQELVVDPRLFRSLGIPGIRDVSIQLKRGRFRNELSRFRYDVLIEVGAQRQRSEVDSVDWLPGFDFARITAPVAVRGVPNTRLIDVGGVDPEELWLLGERRSLAVEIDWSSDPFTFDVLFRDPAAPRPAWRPQWTGSAELTNDPMRAVSQHALIAGLRDRLPDHLVPSTVVVLDRLPLKANGKVDHDALPEPPTPRSGRVPARTDAERAVAVIWARALGLDDIGVTDNFFELGGNSLKAAQVVGELRRVLGAELPIARLFDQPTVRGVTATMGTGEVRAGRIRGQVRRARKRGAR